MAGTLGNRTLDFIESVDQLTAPRDVIENFGEMVREFGYEFFLVTGLPDPGRKLEQEVLLNGWPLGWYSRYTDQDYFRRDPVAHECFVNTQPFAWSDVPQDTARWPLGRQILNEAREFDMSDGLCVPIFGLHGFQSAVTLAGGDPDLSAKAKASIHLASIYVHGRARQLLDSQPGDDKPRARLSARERECLQWAAAGKSSWEIGRILSLSEHTVTGYLKAATVKLNGANRTHAVAEALRRGEIRI